MAFFNLEAGMGRLVMNYDSLLVLGLEVVGSGYDWLRSIYIWHEKELSWDSLMAV